MQTHGRLLLCLAVLALSSAAGVDNQNVNNNTNKTTATMAEERSTTEKPTFYHPETHRSCESDVKEARQEMTDLRLHLETLQLRQDMTSVRSQLRDLQDQMTTGGPSQKPGPPEDTTVSCARQESESDGDRRPHVPPPVPVTPGSVYVRWGSAACPDGASMVYSGVVGGGHYQSPGVGVNALCLPLNPVYDNQQPTNWNTELYGAEYGTVPEEENDLDVVCAVCEIPRPKIFMLPATNTCHPDWTLEYAGYLMAGYPEHTSGSEFVCMDAERDARHGSKSDHNGMLFYYVLSKCGSLPCPPYEEGRVLQCVVCSK